MADFERMQQRFVLAAVAVATLTAAYAGALILLPEHLTKSFSALALLAVMSASVPVLVHRARQEHGRVRQAWLLLAGSASAAALIYLVWSYYQVVHGKSPPPIPSLADVFFVAAVVLVIPAMLQMPGSPIRAEDRLRTVLDGLIVAVSFTLVSWATVLGPAFRTRPTDVVEALLLLAYPMGDVVGLIVAALVLMRAPVEARVTIGLVAAGVTSLSLGDSLFTYLILRGRDPAGGVVTVGWFAGYPLMALAALWPATSEKEQSPTPARRTTVQGAIFPTIAALLGLAVGFLTTPGPFVVIGGLVLIVLVLGRQLLALSAESRYAAALEDRVEERSSEILAQQSYWRALVQNSSDAILVTDTHGIIRYESPAVERVLGFGPEDRLGADRFDFVHPDDVERVRRHFADLEASPGRVSTIEFRQRHADGSWRWVEAAKTNLLHVPEVAGVVSNYRDVTERKRIEAEVQAKNAELAEMAAIVESSDDAIVGTDTAGIVTSWNPAAERLYGYRGDEVVGRPASVFVPANLQEDGLLIDRARRGEPVNNVETQRLRKDGSVFDVALTVSRIVHDGELRGFSVIARDVTERKRMEAELAAARDAALEASRLKSEFLANMSHEIRTPMNGVLGLTGLLLATDLDARQRQYAEGAHTAAEALLGVINDILDFSKIEAGKLEVEVVDFDLRQVVEEAADLLAGPAQRKGLELVGYCDPRLPTALRGDPGRLRQVLINLVSNAVKFTERGEVVVRARPGEAPASPENLVAVHFEVVDSGIGITPADASRLFEPFAQADASTTRRYGGTGLGLAISAELVGAMGGELRVESRPGAGSRFWFALALERQPHVPAGRPAQVHRLQGRRVLIVDDNDTNRLILCEQLRAWQMRPDAVSDGPSALERLGGAADQGAPYELALLDFCMEPIDGLEVARRVSADPRLAGTPLVLLSSGAEVNTAAAAGAGLVARLTKPVRQSQLYDTLMRVMGPEPEAVAARKPPAPPRPGPSRGHILVVEDNLTNQMVATGILEELHYTSEVAGNGQEALAALEGGEYVAVLMDCQMPEMDGYQATAEIRRREGDGRHIAIIAMTAGAMEGDRERCLAAGMDDYVSKPVDPRELKVALERLVTQPAPATAAPANSAAAPLDPARLELLRRMGRGDGGMLRRVAEAFVAQTPADLADLDQAIAGGRLDAVQQVAHRLRGAAANLGATTMAATSAQVEDLARAGTLHINTGPDFVSTLRAEFARVADALETAVAEDGRYRSAAETGGRYTD